MNVILQMSGPASVRAIDTSYLLLLPARIKTMVSKAPTGVTSTPAPMATNARPTSSSPANASTFTRASASKAKLEVHCHNLERKLLEQGARHHAELKKGTSLLIVAKTEVSSLKQEDSELEADKKALWRQVRNLKMSGPASVRAIDTSSNQLPTFNDQGINEYCSPSDEKVSSYPPDMEYNIRKVILGSTSSTGFFRKVPILMQNSNGPCPLLARQSHRHKLQRGGPAPMAERWTYHTPLQGTNSLRTQLRGSLLRKWIVST